ncbi:MAG: TetR family transcriptional regulator [Phycisphaerales bacterium]
MPRARRSIAVETRIIEAAASAFARDGYRDTSVRAVCAAARVNIAAVNYHFGGKPRLFQAALDYAATRGGVVEAVPWTSRAPAAVLRDQVAAILAAIHGEGPDSWLWRITAREAGGAENRVGFVRDALAAELAALADAIKRAGGAGARPGLTEEADRTLTAILAICLNWGRVRPLVPSATGRNPADGDLAAAVTSALLTLHDPLSMGIT